MKIGVSTYFPGQYIGVGDTPLGKFTGDAGEQNDGELGEYTGDAGYHNDGEEGEYSGDTGPYDDGGEMGRNTCACDLRQRGDDGLAGEYSAGAVGWDQSTSGGLDGDSSETSSSSTFELLLLMNRPPNISTA